MTLAVYFAIKVVSLALEDEWHLLATGWGLWYLVEILGFVLLPCLMFAVAYRERRLTLTRVAAGAFARRSRCCHGARGGGSDVPTDGSRVARDL